MFGPRYHLFTLLGFRIYVDLSWFIIVVLIVWSLGGSRGVFAQLAPELADRAALRWMMGGLGAVGLFLSIVLHELGHAKMAERHGVPMRGITLFIFGGVAEMSAEPPSAKAEFMLAIGGPLVSLALGILFAGLGYAGSVLQWPAAATVLLSWLGLINLLLLVFNLIPAFPLDGGRVLRSILWAAKDNLRWATRITSQIGAGFGMVLIILGVFQGITVNLVGGIWLVLIGIFLRMAAQSSYQQLLIRRALEGEPIERFMTDEPVTLQRDDDLAHAVESFVYRYHHKLYPVMDGERLVGCLTMDRLKDVERDQWQHTRVADVMEACDSENTVEHGRDAMDVLSRMRQTERSRLMVVDGDQLLGVVALKDLMDFLSLKIELEERG